MVIAERDLRMLSACLIASGQPRHSHEWAAEALTSVGSRGTHISGQPRHSHPWAAEALTSVGIGATSAYDD